MQKETTVKAVVETHPSIHILDLGSKKRKAIKNLKNGTGKLMIELERDLAALPDDKKHVLVVICKKKRQRGKGRSSFPCSPLSPLSLFR
jgi:hypothetical protein